MRPLPDTLISLKIQESKKRNPAFVRVPQTMPKKYSLGPKSLRQALILIETYHTSWTMSSWKEKQT